MFGRDNQAAQGRLPPNHLVAGLQRPLVGGHQRGSGPHPSTAQNRHQHHLHTQHTRAEGTPLRAYRSREVPHQRPLLQPIPGRQEKFIEKIYNETEALERDMQ